jgi:acetoacetyl-CoA reductase
LDHPTHLAGHPAASDRRHRRRHIDAQFTQPLINVYVVSLPQPPPETAYLMCGSMALTPLPLTVARARFPVALGMRRRDVCGGLRGVTQVEGRARMSEQRVAIVTGGARGIGAAITTNLAKTGTHVAAGYSRSRAPGDELAGKLTAEGYSVSLHQGNVGNPEDCQQMVHDVLAEHGRVDYLVNNAGITVDKTVRKMTVDDWHAVLRVNLSGAFYMTKAVLEHMLDRGFGRIVNISSVIGQTGNVGQANYAASKAGLIGFTKSLALEVAAKGITVNCVAPGFIDTDMVAGVSEKALDRILEGIPVGRLGKAREIARAVQFLVDDDAGYITGSVLAVNGGLDM